MTALEVDGLAMSFGSTQVLGDVCLRVAEHSLTAVLGASGSGKTTLLRLIAGFERPTAGRISLAGRVMDDGRTHVPPERRRLGYVPQEGALFPHLNVAHNVAFGLRRGARHSGRVGELLEMVGLADLGRRYPHELSGGQQQRVALARALALDPPVVLLDEPFSSLDAALRASVRDDIAAVLRAAGTAVVLVTHDQQEALSMADQVAVLRRGHVAQTGSPRAIYSHPVDREMAAFLGAANLVPAQVSGLAAATALGRLPTRLAGQVSGTALVRPEQIAVSIGHDGPGLRGRVVDQTYEGHESVVAVAIEPGGASGAGRALVSGIGVVRARILGTTSFAAGTPVTLTASGEVTVWADGAADEPGAPAGSTTGRAPGRG